MIVLDDFSTLSSPKTGHMSKFSLLCQAAHLLGQVLQHVSSDSAGQDIAWVQLYRTLQSMLTAALDVDHPDYDQITFVYRFVPCSSKSPLSHALIRFCPAPLLLCIRPICPLARLKITTATTPGELETFYTRSQAESVRILSGAGAS